MIPEDEIRHQILENEEILKKHFGEDFKPVGFYFPEMAYSSAAAKVVKEMGYEWTILDEIAFSGKLGVADCGKIYQDQNSGLKVVLRSREISNKYVPKAINEILYNPEFKDKDIVTGTDGELYGLKHIDHTAVFEALLKKTDLKTITISDFVKEESSPMAINIKPHSWATTEAEYKAKQPFNLWQNKKNKIQMKLWELANLVYNTIEENKNDKHYNLARWYLVRGFASCSFWWASGKDFELFGSISWSPDEIERGLNEFIRAIRSLDNRDTRKDKLKAEKLYLAIKKEVWSKHWNKHW